MTTMVSAGWTAYWMVFSASAAGAGVVSGLASATGLLVVGVVAVAAGGVVEGLGSEAEVAVVAGEFGRFGRLANVSWRNKSPYASNSSIWRRMSI
jgi:hypothetical protein